MRSERSGFTLIEALVAAALLGGGIVGVVGALQAITKAEDRARQVETMVRLADDKYQEIRSTTDTFAAGDSGDFVDRKISDYTWTMTVDPTGVTNLDAVTVTVQRRDQHDGDPTATVSGLVFVPPTDTAANGAGAPTP